MKNQKKVSQGKKNRAAGARFELKVRKDLESKGWIVSKWMNNVELSMTQLEDTVDKVERKSNGDLEFTPGEREIITGKLIPAKHKFRGPGIPMAIGTGFPDFIIYHTQINLLGHIRIKPNTIPLGVEVKSNGYLDKEERAKCKWLLEKNIFSKILIASKGPKRGQIVYKEFKI